MALCLAFTFETERAQLKQVTNTLTHHSLRLVIVGC